MTFIAKFAGVGWKLRIQEKKSYHFLTLAKELILGNLLKKAIVYIIILLI